jgi:hypothetical protein
MNYPLFVDMKTKIENDLDLIDETFIAPSEMVDYFNEAIDMIQGNIIAIAEDYMLAHAFIPVSVGDTELQLPSNIYANKIRKLIWKLDESQIYEIMPIRNLMEIPFVNENDCYRYIFVNNGVTNTNTIGTVVKLYPEMRDTATEALTIWYIRSANKYEDDTSVCDIPEWSNIIIQYVRYKCLIKEARPDAEQAKQDLDIMNQQMIQTLTSRTMDENTKLSQDPRTLNDYNDFTTDYYYGL